jgi:hypothetical protein
MGEKWTHLGHKSEAADSSPSNKSIHLPPSPVRMHRSLDRSYTAFLRRPSRIGRKKCGMDPHFLTGLVASDIQLERSWFGEMDRSAFHLFCMNGEASPHCRHKFISLRARYGNTKAESGCAECPRCTVPSIQQLLCTATIAPTATQTCHAFVCTTQMPTVKYKSLLSV